MNTDYPILMFPQPLPDVRIKKQTFVPPPRVPSVKDNAYRLGPKFKELQETLEKKTINIQKDAEGENPEEILVLETAGRVEEFYKALSKVEGFEWLMDEDFDGKPDEDFYIKDDKGKRTEQDVPSRLYLVSANSTALNQIHSLFKQFVETPAMKMQAGYAKFKDVFIQLRDVRFWDYQDRLDGSDFFDEWLRNNEDDDSIRFQVELWYRSDARRRALAQQKIEDLIEASHGRVISTCDIEAIRYHAMLVEVPGEYLRQTMSDLEGWEFIRCSDIMFVKAMPQTTYSIDTDETKVAHVETGADALLPSGKPVVALLDGYPLQNHTLLKDRLNIDDPDEFGSLKEYEVDKRRHGTEMASLIIHGDMSAPGKALDTPLYVRPIMSPDNRGFEQIPEDRLIVDLIHRAVRRMFEGKGTHPATAPNVRIINFSIGDNVRKFYRTMSPLARLFDWLSYKYKVLFVISAGNCFQPISLDCSVSDFKKKTPDEKSTYVTDELLKKRLDMRMLAPAESINNITVGSVHKDASVILPMDNRVNPYHVNHPAVYTPFGGGFNNAIKPDLVFDGGRAMLEEKLEEPNKLFPTIYKREPGLKVAWPDKSSDAMKYDRGTSCTAALISRHAYHCFQELRDILAINNKPETHIHLLMKAMVAHGCSWEELGNSIERYLPSGLSGNAVKAIKRQWIGNGYPDLDKSLMCAPQRVTVLGFGTLKKDGAEIYTLPLPTFLDGKKVKRRLTVTLAWMTPIAPQNQRYRKARLWFELIGDSKLIEGRIDVADKNAPRRGTLQHEVFEGERQFYFKGDEDSIQIKVVCAEDAGNFEGGIQYAIAVSLELTEAERFGIFPENIYNDVRDKLRVPIRISNTANS